MKTLTCKQVLEALQKMTPEQLEGNFSVFDVSNQEVYPVTDFFVSGYGSKYDDAVDGILDNDNAVIVIDHADLDGEIVD